jgi:hypothetical protein
VDDLRRPASIPDEPAQAPFGFGPDLRVDVGVDVGTGIDTDADGRPDTLVADDGFDLILLTDFDGDSFADRMLRIGPDGVVREVGSQASDQLDEHTRRPSDDPPTGDDPW